VLPEAEQQRVVSGLCDMPASRPADIGSAHRPSDLLLPELVVDELAGGQGRPLILFITARY